MTRTSRTRIIGGAVAIITAATTALVAAPASAATTTIVAAPNGSGTTCTEQAPCSLTGAQTRARSAVSAGTAATVLLRGGEYSLTDTFTLSPEDSGTTQNPVVYRAYGSETPVLTSARTLNGWADAGGGVYSASTAGAQFRQLYVNGVRATPARYPNAGSEIQLQSSNRTAKTLRVLTEQFQTFANADLSQVDFVTQLQWGETYARLKSASDAGTTSLGAMTDLTLQDEEANILFQRPFPLLSDGSPVHFENAREFIDVPGEFFVDRKAQRVFYMPRAGENLSSTYTVPALDTLLQVKGSATAPVHDISIQGITFQDSGWNRPTTNGYLNGQGGLYNISANMQNQQYTDRPPAGVYVTYADRISVTGNTFRRMGSTALDIDTAVHDSSAVGNVITDVSGNGIMVGKFSDPDVEFHTPYNPADINEVTARVTVSNNVINGTGRVYTGTAGINGGYLRNTSIVNNDISDSPWAGISTGWGWNHAESAQRENTIARNRIGNIQTNMCDTGGFYHLSNDPGTSFSRNYVHDIVRQPTACSSNVGAVYLDEGSDNMTVSENVHADVEWGVHFNFTGSNNNVYGNVDENKQWIQESGLEPAYRGLLQKINIAAGKAASSSTTAGNGSAAGLALDGDLSTGWSPAGADTASWWQVDLGTATALSQVSLTTRQDLSQPETRRNFEIRGSNDPSFGSYTVLAKRDGKTIADAGTYTSLVRDRGAYRYVRVAKTDAQPFFITEFSLQASGGSVSTPAVPAFDGNLPLTLTNVNSGLVLDVDDRSTANGADVLQWTPTGATNQQWYLRRATGNLFTIVNVNSGKALDNYSMNNKGSQVRQWTTSAESQQLWSVEPRGDAYVIRNIRSGQLLEIGGASKTPGAKLIQWADNVQSNQLWRITSDALSVEAAASTRMIAGKAYVVVTATNRSTVATKIDVVTPYGKKTFAAVQPGKTISAATNSGQPSIPAGSATVTASASINGRDVTTTVAAPYNAQ
nr:RICIN domain-containing protein [Microbacterium testaceum]